ncbi:hypothetical protein [Neisseria elongata]
MPYLKFPFHAFLLLFVEQADAQSKTIVWFPAVLSGKIKKGLRQADVVVFIGKPGAVFRRQPVRECRPASRRNRRPNPKETAKEGEINFAIPILQGRLPAAHDKKASVPNKANIFSCPLSTSLPKTPDENPLKNCLCRYRTKSANRAMFATDKAVSWFNLSRFSQNSHHFNGFPRLFFIFRRPLYSEAV